MVSKDGIRADLNEKAAILNIEPPSTVPELHRFMGMTNQMGKFLSRLEELSQPLWELLSTKRHGCGKKAKKEHLHR